jgi:hypothetical protein
MSQKNQKLKRAEKYFKLMKEEDDNLESNLPYRSFFTASIFRDAYNNLDSKFKTLEQNCPEILEKYGVDRD